MESLYRRNPNEKDKPFEVLNARRGLLRPNSGNTPVQVLSKKSASVRNPAYIRLTGYNRTCDGSGTQMTLPIQPDTWDKLYGKSSKTFKPVPDVESVTVEYGGTWGLAQTISATIKCYTISDFETVLNHFLVPGNQVELQFGHAESISWGVVQSVKLKKYTVATFSFSATQEGAWVCTFTAVSSAQAIKNLDMQITICNGCNPLAGEGQGKTGPIKYMTGIEKTPHPVKGVVQLIAADAQENGKIGIDDTKDGTVFTKEKFIDYKPGTDYGDDAAIVIYTGDHIRSGFEKLTAGAKSMFRGMSSTTEVQSSNNQVYISLGYIVHRIIDDQLLRAMTCGIINQSNANDREKFFKLKVEFHPKYSKSFLPPGITSGDPTTLLLLGDANYKNSKDAGKNFDADCKNLAAVKALNGSEVRLQNILVHRDIILNAFADATSAREAQSDTTDVKDTKEEVINIEKFFNLISDHISACVGQAMALRLVEDPDDSEKLIVVDQNAGLFKDLQCYVFDPINGDGSTRSCEIQSNVGGQEYRAAMFIGASKKGDPIAAIRGCSKALKEQRAKELSKAKADKEALIKDPGNLGKNTFGEEEINALKSAMTRLYRSNKDAESTETLHWPGLSMSITLDGVYGIVPGCAISSTQVPKKWRDSMKSYFMVTKVTHNIQNSDWSTQIEGILSYYNNIKYIP